MARKAEHMTAVRQHLLGRVAESCALCGRPTDLAWPLRALRPFCSLACAEAAFLLAHQQEAG